MKKPEPEQQRAPRPPRGLSLWSRRAWADLHMLYDFSSASDVLCERMLRRFDLADTFLARAEKEGVIGKTGRVHPLVAASRDAEQTGLRFWRALQLEDEPEDGRRPGRPGGEGWSAKHREGMAQWRQRFGAGA